jgi:glycosyltransferase involved in cell wall biosynthesis
MGKPAVSLILCTRNRAEQLKDCLEYIAGQNSSCPWEPVVVDNGSTDNTGRILSEYAAKVPFRLTVIYEGEPCRSRGLNEALRVCQGEIIALTDDDCYVAPDYLDRVLEIFEDPKIGFVGGRVELFDSDDYPMTVQTSTDPMYLPPRSYVEPGWILGANMMFRRKVLEAIDGFDVELGPGMQYDCDDTDVQARASFGGWWGFYSPMAIVYHHHRRKAKDIPALRHRYAMGNGAYKTKFLLVSDTRSIYLRASYWAFRRVLRNFGALYAIRNFMGEAQGAAIYLSRRLRKLIAGAS